MLPLVFFGDYNDRRIPNALCKANSSRLVCSVLAREEIFWKAGSKYILIEQDSPRFFKCDSGIIILKDSFNHAQTVFDCENVCIVNSQNPKSVEWASKSSKTTIACGASPYDTLTFSSLTSDKAVVSLQRQLVIPATGQTLEPADFPISINSNQDIYTILAVAAVLLISGNENFLSDLIL